MFQYPTSLLTIAVSRGHSRYANAQSDSIAVIAMSQHRFELDREYIELHQLLKLTGLCDSGGAGKHLVASGVVSVDGNLEARKTCKIRAGQRITVRINDEDAVIEVIAAA
jgi:ribosome-associated protein